MKLTINDYETRNGLLYRKGETDDKNFLNTLAADAVARILGYMYAEQVVQKLKEQAGEKIHEIN